MTLGVALATVLAVGGSGPGATTHGTCERMAIALTQRLQGAELAKEPQDEVRAVSDGAEGARARCPGNETLAYLRARSAELGRGAFLGEQRSPAADADWRRLTREAAARFPQSARILAMAARATDDVGTAQRAVALDGQYVPARVALAAALIDAGNAHLAVQTLDHLKGTRRDERWLHRPRSGAPRRQGPQRRRTAANEALTHRRPELIEADAGTPWPLSEAHEIAAVALIGLGQFDEAAGHLQSAVPQTARVQELLAHPSPGLQKALDRNRRAKASTRMAH